MRARVPSTAAMSITSRMAATTFLIREGGRGAG
jgi:hypothetical protein